MKRTALDVTSGSIDKRARAELDEIEQMNNKVGSYPQDFEQFKEKLEKMAHPKFDHSYGQLENSYTIKEDVDPNERTYMS